MSDYSDSLVKKYESLPADLKEALFSVPIADKLSDIANKNNLHIDQAGFLQSLVEQVIVGSVHPKDLMHQMVLLMQIDEPRARQIILDTNERVFLPIRASLQKIHQMRENENLGDVMTGEQPSSHEILSAISNPESIGKMGSVPFTIPKSAVSNFAQYETPTDFSKPPVATTNRIPETPPARVPITAIPTPAATPKPSPIPVPAPVATIPTMNIHEEKLAGPVHNPMSSTTVNNQTTVSIIPDDHKVRINSDPYKEKI